MVDTNSDPREVDYVIPANDDASKSVKKVISYVSDSIIAGLSERKADKDAKKESKVSKEDAPKKEAKAEPKKDVEVPSKDAEDKEAMKEAKKEVKLESKQETLEKATSNKEEK